MVNKVFDDFFEDEIKDTLTANTKYNIEKTSFNTYELTMAVPGFTRYELDISFKDGILTIKGVLKEGAKDNKEFLYNGLTIENFENSFSLSNRLEVAVATLRDGLLIITLKDKSTRKDLIKPI